MKVRHTKIKNQRIITSFAILTLDETGLIIDPILDEAQVAHLMKIPNFKIVEEDIKEEVKEEVIEEVKEELVEEVVEEKEELNLKEMKVAELKALAKEHNIDLEATKKADIVKELTAKLNL